MYIHVCVYNIYIYIYVHKQTYIGIFNVHVCVYTNYTHRYILMGCLELGWHIVAFLGCFRVVLCCFKSVRHIDKRCVL